MELVKQGGESFFGNTKTFFVHLEYASVYNRKCSYCMEGNGVQVRDF